MAVETFSFDAARYLQRGEAQAELLSDAFATGDASFITAALKTVARARGLETIAHEEGLGQEPLDVALGVEGGPRLSQLLDVMRALGVRLHVETTAT